MPGRVVMKHSFEVPLSEQTQVLVSGQMINQGKGGAANVVGTVRHQFSNRLWAEGTYTLLRPRVLTAKGTYTVDENTQVLQNNLTRLHG
jgi:DnaJ family protein C protein 11